jgi:hypothetical protein
VIKYVNGKVVVPNPVLTFDALTTRASIRLHLGQTVSFADSLSRILGFGKKQMPLTHDEFDGDPMTVQARKPADIRAGIHQMYVYNDVSENVSVGDASAPLLRIVDAEGKHGQTVHRDYDRPKYLPVQKKHFDSILVDIRDDVGHNIPFEYGKVVVILHFRQVKQNYFSQ